MDKYEAAQKLDTGEQVYIRTNNGSCQCGDTSGTLSMRDGVLWVKSSGGADWQDYDGPAQSCQVGYGFGATCQEVAALVEDGQDINVPYSFSHGTYIYQPCAK